MTFPRPKPTYDASDEAKFRDQVKQETARAYKRGESIELWPGNAIFLRDEDGARWKVTVSTTGSLVVTSA